MLYLKITSGSFAVDVAAYIITSVCTLLLATRIFTEARFWLRSRGAAGRFQGREPLTLPYTIPWLGGATRMMGGHSVYKYAESMSPLGRPVKLRVGSLNMYILFGPKNMKAFFRNSKSVSKDASSIMLFKNTSMPAKDVQIFKDDQSGYGATSLTEGKNETRIWKRTHDLGSAALANGPDVNLLTSRFMEEFVTELDMAPLEKTISIPLYDFLKKKMFVASTISLVGTEIFRLNPGLVKTYWDFDDGFLMTAIGLPKVLIPKQYAALDRMLQASKRWIDSAYSQLDPKESDAEWEENFGSKFIRKVAEVLTESGVSREGQAVAMLPLIWAINSNAIPCAGWMIFEILKHPGLFQRLREEVSPFMTSQSTGKTRFDIPNLVSNSPLLTSLYLETIRTCTSSSPTRRLMQDLEVDGYILKKDNHIMASSWIPAHSTIWDVPGHPANSFWPERFIEMPKMKPKDPEEKSAYEIAMRPENFFPYGGGNVVCSGRFFAKQEIMTAVALLVMKFDIDFEGGWVTTDGKTSERGAKCNESLAGSGVLTPDRDMVVKMKRVR